MCVMECLLKTVFEPRPDGKFSEIEVSGHVSQTEGRAYVGKTSPFLNEYNMPNKLSQMWLEWSGKDRIQIMQSL